MTPCHQAKLLTHSPSDPAHHPTATGIAAMAGAAGLLPCGGTWGSAGIYSLTLLLTPEVALQRCWADSDSLFAHIGSWEAQVGTETVGCRARLRHPLYLVAVPGCILAPPLRLPHQHLPVCSPLSCATPLASTLATWRHSPSSSCCPRCGGWASGVESGGEGQAGKATALHPPTIRCCCLSLNPRADPEPAFLPRAGYSTELGTSFQCQYCHPAMLPCHLAGARNSAGCHAEPRHRPAGGRPLTVPQVGHSSVGCTVAEGL